ncbi:MAG: cyclic nucleotide-binding domain-containing protein [Pseudomonadales bacterium]|nr:cyclic nucleotide-binding domain-containing protein [Pseudomonadales bacterium]
MVTATHQRPAGCSPWSSPTDLHRTLRRFDDFRTLDRDTLATVARHARGIEVPADRTLLTAGRQLAGRLYLAAGVLSVAPPQRRIDAMQPAARIALYPGVDVIRSVTSAGLLHVDWDRVAFLLRDGGRHVAGEGRETWESRFFSSPLIRTLPMSAWRFLMTRFHFRAAASGVAVVREHAVEDCCYVLTQGHAVSHRASTTLAYLLPGDLFGEDSPVTGGQRLTSVTMLEDGQVASLDGRVFRELVVELALEVVHSVGPGTCVNVGPGRIPGAINLPLPLLERHVRRLDRSVRHYVVGGSFATRRLATLSLRRLGVSALLVDA